MSAEELYPAEDIEKQVAVPAGDELSAAKEKSKVEDTEDDAPPSDSDDDNDGSDDDDSDDDDSDDDDDEDDDEKENGEKIKDAAVEPVEPAAVAVPAQEPTGGSDASEEGEKKKG